MPDTCVHLNYPTVSVLAKQLQSLISLLPAIGGDTFADSEALYDNTSSGATINLWALSSTFLHASDFINHSLPTNKAD